MNIDEAYKKYGQKLSCIFPESEAEQNVKYIISEILTCSIPDLLINKEKQLSTTQIKKIEETVTQRANHTPLQYIFKKAYFRDLELYVNKGVLIPRPETEILVDIAITHLPMKGKLCDIGCGSGAIPLSIAYERQDSEVIAIDFHPIPLEITKINIEKYSLKNVKTQHSDLLSEVKKQEFDVITANLPYVTIDEYNELEKEVAEFEPITALVAEDNGMRLINKLILQAPDYLKQNGFLILEIGEQQGNATMESLKSCEKFHDIKVIKDYNQKDRFVIAFRN